MKLLKNKSGLSGTLTVPADKSISHRSIMFGAISHGKTTIHNFLRAEDCLSTVAVFKALGVTIYDDGEVISIEGKGFTSTPADFRRWKLRHDNALGLRNIGRPNFSFENRWRCILESSTDGTCHGTVENDGRQSSRRTRQ